MSIRLPITPMSAWQAERHEPAQRSKILLLIENALGFGRQTSSERVSIPCVMQTRD